MRRPWSTLLVLFGCDPGNLAAVGTPPAATITAPTEGASFAAYSPLTLTAVVNDAQTAPEALDVVWSSSLGPVEGAITRDGNTFLLLAEAGLPPGAYTLALDVTDEDGESTQDTVGIVVVAASAPVVEVLSPRATEPYDSLDAIVVSALVTDADAVGNESLGIEWTGVAAEAGGPAFPNADGYAEFTLPALAAGSYELGLTVTDASGLAGSASTTFMVVDADPDVDGDGYPASEDCDDLASDVHPFADEGCNGIDDDCDDEIDNDALDPLAWYDDDDGDGYGDPSSVEYACELPDGYADNGEDCDDSNGAAHPFATEFCNAVDDDCDGLIDAEDPDVTDLSVWYADADVDGYGDPAAATTACFAPTGSVVNDDDCDDSSASVYPAASETCDGLDNDCDGVADDADSDRVGGTVWYIDDDGDGFGNVESGAVSCDPLSGWVADSTDCDDADHTKNPAVVEADCSGMVDLNCDGNTPGEDADNDGFLGCEECDDTDAAVNPDVGETCDGIDNNCDGYIDEAGATGEASWYADFDGDGAGDDGEMVIGCEAPASFVAIGGDCDALDADFYPGAPEPDCTDPNDYNCDGSVAFADSDADSWAACVDCDDADASVADFRIWYGDDDGDGHGDTAFVAVQCKDPGGYVLLGDDCDDRNRSVYPGATEADCSDPTDYNCDGSTGYDDLDSDGSPACEDCDDGNGGVSPDATETCNGTDDDCDGLTDFADGDVVDAQYWYGDADGDGYGSVETTIEACEPPSGFGTDISDCDDTSASHYPGAPETCDGADDDCDGLVDDADPDVSFGTYYADLDGDGYGDALSAVAACGLPAGYTYDPGDCDDLASLIHPEATEICDGADNDCDGDTDDADVYVADWLVWYADSDGDGYGDEFSAIDACEQPAGYVENYADCNDVLAAVNPVATEACNGYDDDCDDVIDGRDAPLLDGTTYYADTDNDGFGNAASSTVDCSAPFRHVRDATDCDDSKSTVNPQHAEICDDQDNNCDGLVDDADSAVSGTATWYADGDGDGFGGSSTVTACDAPAAYVATSTDCDDAQASVYPGATEVCDTLDNDCDGATDDADSYIPGRPTWYLDADGDSFGTWLHYQIECFQPSGYVADNTDCNDASAAINPGGTEVCNSIDDDCDAKVDDNDSSRSGGTVWYADADRDGYGVGSSTTTTCSVPSGYSAVDTDCDDTNITVHPGRAEVCNGRDDDCNALVDAADSGLVGGSYFLDSDLDGYGDAASPVLACAAASGLSTNASDCDDAAAEVNPSASEKCNSLDDDCDGLTDDADNGVVGAPIWYADADGDTYGVDSSTVNACLAPSAYAPEGGDCDEGQAAVNPGAVETCNTIDDDCDGAIDDADTVFEGTEYYADTDLDGYGDPNNSVEKCSLPSGYVTDDQDCGDADPTVNPLGTEVCDDRVDNDCDGSSGTCADNGVHSLYSDAYTWIAPYDAVGGSVSIRGDVNNDGVSDFVGGQMYYGTVQSYLGPFAEGFDGSGTERLTMSGRGSNEYFGVAVSSGGDYDVDGSSDILVGAVMSSVGATYAGAAYLFSGALTGSADDTDATLIVAGGSQNDMMGYATALEGDLDGDGQSDVVVAAPWSYNHAGRIFGFYAGHSGTLAMGDADLVVGSGTSLAWVGRAIGTDGDLDGDGQDDLVAAAPYSGGGKVYVFSGPLSGNIATSTADVVIASSQSHMFGNAGYVEGTGPISPFRDMNGDGGADLVVGSAYANSNAGAAYVLFGPLLGTYSPNDADVSMVGEASTDSLGFANSLASDLDGDGRFDLAAGASLNDDGGTDGGSTYILYGGALGAYAMPGDADVQWSGTNGLSGVGSALAAGGDLNDDGADDLVTASISGGQTFLIAGQGL